jgi:O-acetylhomoserine/O-acetylserine sulfhydrylase-like pyridoxal-dependent enzyme
MSPDNAWIIVQGIETFSLHMEMHCNSAHSTAKVAKTCDDDNCVSPRFLPKLLRKDWIQKKRMCPMCEKVVLRHLLWAK